MASAFGLITTAIALALAACGGSGDSQSTPAASAPTKNAALPQTSAAPRTSPTTTARASVTTRAPVTTVKAPATTTTASTTTTTTTLVTVPATGPNTCTAQGPCTVGQTGPVGGIVFYVAPTPQRWGQYLEVRPTAFEKIAPDTCNLDAYDSYGAGRIGDGITQTAAVIAACAKDGKPASAGSYARVASYSQNGYGGWFIPAKDELQALLDSKVVTFPTDQDLTSGTW